ncbi:DUF1501 domain-containing protein [Thiolapillus sp.]
MKNMTRRNFLKHSLVSAASLSMAALVPTVRAAGGNEYRALVCVLLEGGADSCNMLVPTGTDAWENYHQLRGNMALARTELLELPGYDYGLHPRMTKLQQLFGQGQLAVIANVGPLVQPVSREEAAAGENIPLHLFSHNSQRDLWMTANARNIERTGWAGRLKARMADNSPFFNTSVSGRDLMQRGPGGDAMVVNGDIAPFDDFYRVRDGDTDAGLPYRKMIRLGQKHENLLVRSFADTRQNELELLESAGGMLDGVETSTAFPTGVHESGKPLGEQLQLVARLIQASQIPGNVPGNPQRQIFFVNHHGWDTHNTPLDSNSHQVDYLDKSLGAFMQEMHALGLENQVTTFTISDFGRSLTANGSGTDHGWGGHAWVMGGAVNAGIHGTMPDIKINSPDALDDRLIPTLSVEQYLATLSRWFGAGEDDIDVAFPNLGSFSTRDLGFMSAT